MELAVTPSFLESAFALDKKILKYTLSSIADLKNNQKSNSLSIHKINKCKCDDSFRSARVNDDVRIIFAARGDVCTLLFVGHHETAYHWCEDKYLGKTSFGAEMIYDEKQMQQAASFIPQPAVYGDSAKALLDGKVKEKQLKKIGITEIHAQNLMKIADEDQFIDYIQMFPQEIQEALLSLETAEKDFDTIYLELTDDEFERGEKTEHKDTQRRFHMLQDLHELEEILNNDEFEKWTVFLHPDQERLVKMNFQGPALIEGGPGTGKTIVGIHRAIHLARNEEKKILFCTFSKKLASFIEKKLQLLALQKGVSAERITVCSVESYIASLYKQVYSRWPVIADTNVINTKIKNLYDATNPSGSLAFYQYEYREVIEQNHIRTLEQYLNCDRSGHGKMPLNPAQRTKAWNFFGNLIRILDKENMRSYTDIAFDVLEKLNEGILEKEYDSIIIDEAQDLETVKIRLLCASVRDTDNNAFILSDNNQRVFRLTSWKKDTGLNIRGRAFYLTVNYRTTKQISDYARNEFAASDPDSVRLRDYKSIVNGIPPIVQGFSDSARQMKYIIEKIKAVSSYCPAEQICVICPSSEDVRYAHSVLDYEGVASIVLQGDLLPSKGSGVNICTIKGVKGLEFRIVFLYNYTNINRYENNTAMTGEILENYRKLAECEKYVATTRARDELYITYTEEDDDE